MSHRFTLAALAALLASPALSGAAETYTIKLKQPGKGDVVRYDIKMSQQYNRVIRDADKKDSEKPLGKESGKVSQVSAFKEEIVEREPGKRPTRLRRTYTKAEIKQGDTTKAYPWQGKTLLIDKKAKGYEFKLEGDRLLIGQEALPLAMEFPEEEQVKLDRLFLPRNAVAVGEEWKLDLDALVKEMTRSGSLEIDRDKATGTGKLVKVYQKGGRRYAVWTVRYELPLKSLGKGEGKMTAEAGSKQKAEFTYDGCIDGTSTSVTTKIRYQMKVAGTINNTRVNRKFHINQDDTTETEVKREEVKP